MPHDELAVDIERHGRATRSIDAAVTALDGTLVAEATIEWVFLGDAQPQLKEGTPQDIAAHSSPGS